MTEPPPTDMLRRLLALPQIRLGLARFLGNRRQFGMRYLDARTRRRLDNALVVPRRDRVLVDPVAHPRRALVGILGLQQCAKRTGASEAADDPADGRF
jgi:hypothetical protein